MITLTSGERKVAIVGLANFLLSIAELEKAWPAFSYSGPRPSKMRDFVKYASSVEDWLTVWRGAMSCYVDSGIYVRRTQFVSAYNVRTLSGDQIPDLPVAGTRFIDAIRRMGERSYHSPAIVELAVLSNIPGIGNSILFPKVFIDGLPAGSIASRFFQVMLPAWAGESRLRTYCEACGLPMLTLAARCQECKNA